MAEEKIALGHSAEGLLAEQIVRFTIANIWLCHMAKFRESASKDEIDHAIRNTYATRAKVQEFYDKFFSLSSHRDSKRLL